MSAEAWLLVLCVAFLAGGAAMLPPADARLRVWRGCYALSISIFSSLIAVGVASDVQAELKSELFGAVLIALLFGLARLVPKA